IDNYTLSRIFSAAYSDLRESQSNNHYFVSMRDVAVLELLFATGVRVSELCSITCENLNFDTYNSLTPNWYYKVLR
ncbi:MAG: tyrosine-type recombinase/integrase, partial [Blautia wexlerae]